MDARWRAPRPSGVYIQPASDPNSGTRRQWQAAIWVGPRLQREETGAESKITQKLKIRFLVHKCNESLMSSNPLQTMKTKFKPLKKFSALVKCISSGGQNFQRGQC